MIDPVLEKLRRITALGIIRIGRLALCSPYVVLPGFVPGLFDPRNLHLIDYKRVRLEDFGVSARIFLLIHLRCGIRKVFGAVMIYSPKKVAP